MTVASHFYTLLSANTFVLTGTELRPQRFKGLKSTKIGLGVFFKGDVCRGDFLEKQKITLTVCTVLAYHAVQTYLLQHIFSDAYTCT